MFKIKELLLNIKIKIFNFKVILIFKEMKSKKESMKKINKRNFFLEFFHMI